MALTFAYRTINTLIFYNNTPTEPFLHSIVLFITYYFNFIANLVILHWKCTVLSMCTKNGFGLQELAHIPLVIYFLVRPLCSNQLLAYLIPKFEFSLPVTHRG